MAFIDKTSTFGDNTHIFAKVYTVSLTDGTNEVKIKDIGVGGAPDWVTGTKYTKSQLVYSNGDLYIVLTTHIADTIANDLTNGNIKKVGGADAPKGATISTWETGKEYKANDVFLKDYIMYVVKVNHTSGTFATDYSSGYLVKVSGDGSMFKYDSDGDLVPKTPAEVSLIDTTLTADTINAMIDARLAELGVGTNAD